MYTSSTQNAWPPGPEQVVCILSLNTVSEAQSKQEGSFPLPVIQQPDHFCNDKSDTKQLVGSSEDSESSVIARKGDSPHGTVYRGPNDDSELITESPSAASTHVSPLGNHRQD